ncbi:bifunctional serine/threonine-protein kinase/glutamate ABC transporter substrate-binding protein [Streptosporangium roseum]|uniref:Serine/threonine protein kinase-like protein n=1 Tax=Streptosporangium roseum (strain ATCC 12428 / DSM 43021 / JCM 3005 / KCTC 9067 / NCIMB 10171 / NRRL 2505 / NI 9100) TaxID=479432 RepID=D2B8Y8_STRRD|nr:bifunctional serine/threonine-protein kinase/glutamate ABC transporter substrate-binding protein [Streptosporangium roseum]ACZ89744.1 Serine/threonine protein kinase-like protein [Streptosporangium roseum DSM 43021]
MPEIRPLRPGDPPQLGSYTLRGRLGEGGQGVVYLGESEDGERAAIKLLHVRFTGEAQARSRFARELTAARRVAAFCTARVLVADLDGETPYIASELIDGPSLRQVVERDGPLGGEALERLAIGTATALTAIHQAGIAHRDFKPDNVLLAADGPRVVDFGIAKIIDESGTITTRAVGTPAYMAPEQIADEHVGLPADVFAWASTIVFSATGKAPFGGDTIVATLNRVINHEADLSALPGDLRATVASCLNKDQRLRPTSDEVLKRLLGHPVDESEASEEVLAEGAQAATVDLTRVETRPTARRRRRMAATAAATAALGLAATFAVLQFGPAFGGNATVLPGRGTPTPAPESTVRSPLLDRIKAGGVLRVGYRDGFPGVSLGVPPTGFEVEVAEYIARALKVPEGKVRFVPVGYADREAAVERGKVDLVIANLSIDSADRSRVAFAGPYYVAHRDVLVRAGMKISEVGHLRGKKLCLAAGQSTGSMISDMGVTFVAVHDNDTSRCANRVADGRADALPGDDVLIAGFGARLRGPGLKIAGIRLTTERYGVALRSGDPRACQAINGAIRAMYADGTMQALLERNFGRVGFRFETGLPRLEDCR